MPWWGWFGAGAFVGMAVTMIVSGCCVAAADADRRVAEFEERRRKGLV